MRAALVVALVVTACSESSEFEKLPEQPPSPMEGDETPAADGEPEAPAPQAPEPCTDEVLSAETQFTGIDEDDGRFRIHLSSQEDVCEEVGWWGGWSLSVAFDEGRPVPGTYVLGEDDGLDANASHAVGKTQATPTFDPPGRLQILEVRDDGTIEGVLCDVVIDRDSYDLEEETTLTIAGRFTAGPC